MANAEGCGQRDESMMSPRTTLAEFLRAAGKAHHRAFAATSGEDPGWAEWYARDLAATLSAFLGIELRPDTLTADFKTVDAEMRARAPLADWAQYYADWFLARHPARTGHGGHGAAPRAVLRP